MTDEQHDTNDIDALLDQCRSSDRLTQIRAMMALEKAGAEEAVPAIVPLLQSEDEGVRAAAADALGELGGEWLHEVGPALEACFGDPEWLVRNAAVEALGFLGHMPSRPALEDVLRSDPQWEVRASAAEALGALGDPRALDVLEAALDDEAHPVRAYAAFAMGQLGDASRLPAIRRRLAVEEHPLPRSDMIVVALRFGDESALDDLLALIQKVDDPEGAIHVYSAIDELMNDHPPSIFVQRAGELEQPLAELGQRMGAGEDSHAFELRQRLIALASSADDESKHDS